MFELLVGLVVGYFIAKHQYTKGIKFNDNKKAN